MLIPNPLYPQSYAVIVAVLLELWKDKLFGDEMLFDIHKAVLSIAVSGVSERGHVIDKRHVSLASMHIKWKDYVILLMMAANICVMHFRCPGFRRLQLLTKGGAPVAFVEFQVQQAYAQFVARWILV